MYEIEKSFTFDAAHYLPEVRTGHPCGQTHGHTYRLTVYLRADQLEQPSGWVCDYAWIAERVAPVLGQVDHGILNDCVENPTTENLARWFFESLIHRLPGLFAVEVAESSTTAARYRP